MKKLLSVILTFLFTLSVYAQKDVTKFLGFDVDGTKSEFVRKLKTKGFKQNTTGDNDFLAGRFNGVDVHVYITTENGLVSRVMVCDENPVDVTNIKIRFNRLCKQFKDNGKYMSLNDNTIPDSEDIAYEMTVHKKRYEAVFYQMPDESAMELLQGELINQISSKYTPEQLEAPTEEIKTEMMAEATSALFKHIANKSVWFMISEYFGKYYITMFYDNEYNRPQGEDL